MHSHILLTARHRNFNSPTTILIGDMKMAYANGYAVIKGAVPLNLVQQAAEEMSKGSLKVIVQRVKYKEFEVPGVCSQIRDEFMAVRSLIFFGESPC